MTNGLDVFAQSIITGNLLLIQGLGLYALIKHTKDRQDAVRHGLTTFVGMVVGSIFLWLFSGLSFQSPGAEVGFYLVIGVVAALLAPRILGHQTSFEESLSCSALVGLLLLLGRDGITGVYNLWYSISAGLGYFLAFVVMAIIRQRLDLAPIPKSLRGAPIILITAGVLALALLGFRF